MTTSSSTQSSQISRKNVAACIIGSGLGGLECARILAHQGCCVTVLEREYQPGGCTQSYRRGRFLLDTGMHYVGGLAEGQSLHDAFKELNLLHLPWVRLDSDGFDRITIGGHTYRLAEGYNNFVETLAKDFPSQRQALEHYAGTMRLSGSNDPKIARWMMETNAWDWLHETFSDPLLINVLSGSSMKLELRKESLPLFTFMHCNSSYIESSWRLRGNGSQISQSLIHDIESEGGKVVCNAEVVELKETDGRITEAVCKDGRTFTADVFISDIHPAAACSLVKESQKIRQVFRRRMAEQTNTCGMFTVSLVLKPHKVRYFNHNHFVYRNADVWDFYLKDGPVGGEMISCRVPDDANVSADGRLLDKELWAEQIDLLTPMTWSEVEQWADTTVGHRPESYKAFKARRAEECVRLAETVVPGISEAIESVYTSTPLTYRDYTLTPQGSAFGMRKDSGNALMTEISIHTPVPNLLLTGQSVILHGIQGVTMTAFETTSEIGSTM